VEAAGGYLDSGGVSDPLVYLRKPSVNCYVPCIVAHPIGNELIDGMDWKLELARTGTIPEGRSSGGAAL